MRAWGKDETPCSWPRRGGTSPAFDISDGGIQVAQKNAASAGLRINTIVADAAHFDYGSSRWDLIVITYEPFPVSDPGFVQKIRDALRPGGLLVIESFASEEGTSGRRPVDIDPARLLRVMLPLRMVKFEDTEDIAD